MAVEPQLSLERELSLERGRVTFEGMRVSWGGIWAGVLIVLGILLLLSTLGFAIGFSADARNVDPEKIGTGAVIWSRVSLLVALFLGSIAATRISMVWDRVTGLAQGALVWVVSLVIVLFLKANGVGLMLGGALVYGATPHTQAEPSATAWVTFFSVVLSLLAALAGSVIGQRRAAARFKSEID